MVVYNSASSPVVNLLSPPRVSTSSSRKHIGNFSSSAKSVSLGLPVTYLRDSRKGFLDVLPSLIECLEKYPVRLFLCGVDSDAYLDHILSSSLSLHPDSCIESFGFLAPTEMSTFYTKLDFLMHFAQFDNSPNVVTESLCSGIPVIVLDNSGSPEHVRFSSAGFVLSDLKQLSSVVASISSSLVDVESLKRKALHYSETALSPRAMALSYSRYLK